MKKIKLMALTLLCVGLTNCKITGSSGNEVIFVPIGDSQLEDPQSSNHAEVPIYAGKYRSLQYFVGEWVTGPNSPSHSIILNLSVDSQGKVSGALDTPSCKTQGIIDAVLYSEVIDILLNAEKMTTPSDFYVEAGLNQVILTDDRDVSETIFIRNSDGITFPLLTEVDAIKVETKFSEIIDALKTSSPCSTVSNSDISVFYFNQNHQQSTTASIETPQVIREFEVRNRNGELEVYGSESILSNTEVCTKLINGLKISSALMGAMEAVVFTHREIVCMTMPNIIESYGILYNNDDSIEGNPGCYAKVGVTNHSAFKQQFLNWLNQQPATCEDLIGF